MQVYDSNTNGIGSSAANSASQTSSTSAVSGKTRGAAAAAGGPTDAVDLSSFAQQINDLQQETPAREARIQELRSQYVSGSYQVDAAAVASRMVDEALIG